MKTVSIVFSFYNEEDSLPLLVKEISDVMSAQPYAYELVFVNDASSDGSVKVIEETTKGLPNSETVIVHMSRRFGVEECFMAGMRQAKGDAVILMYADLQDPPQMIADMLNKWQEGADVVHARRTRRINEHPLKIVLAHVAYRWISGISDIEIPVDTGEFKLISRRALTHLLQLKEGMPYLRGLVPWVGFNQTVVEYEMRPRIRGRSKIPMLAQKSWTVFLSGLISFSFAPIYWILLAGSVGLAIALVSCLVMLPALVTGQTVVGGGTALLLFLWSTLMLAIGIVGLYVSRIYLDTRGRPLYIVKDVQQIKS